MKNIFYIIGGFLAVTLLYFTTQAFDVDLDENSILPNGYTQGEWSKNQIQGDFTLGYDTFEWRYGNWTSWAPAGATCGRQDRSRSLLGCYIVGSNQEAEAEAACNGITKPPQVENDDRNLGTCYTGTWRANAPTACSNSCGRSARTNRGSVSCRNGPCDPADEPDTPGSIRCDATPNCDVACDAGGVATFSLSNTNVGTYVKHDGWYIHPIGRCVNNLSYRVDRHQNNDWPAIGTQYNDLENYPSSPWQVYSGGDNRLLLSVNKSSNPGNCTSGYTWVHSLIMTFEDYSPSTGGVYGTLAGNTSIAYTGCTAPTGCNSHTQFGCTFPASDNGVERVCSPPGGALLITATCDIDTWDIETEIICSGRGSIASCF